MVSKLGTTPILERITAFAASMSATMVEVVLPMFHFTVGLEVCETARASVRTRISWLTSTTFTHRSIADWSAAKMLENILICNLSSGSSIP